MGIINVCIRMNSKFVCVFVGVYGILICPATAILLSCNIYGPSVPVLSESFSPGTTIFSLRRCFIIALSLNAVSSAALIWGILKKSLCWVIPVFVTLPMLFFLQFGFILLRPNQANIAMLVSMSIWMLFHAYLFMVFFAYIQSVDDADVEGRSIIPEAATNTIADGAMESK